MSRFVENKAGIRQQAFHPGLSAALYARARQIAASARQLSPSDRVAREIVAETPTIDENGALSRVNAHHWTSGFVEFGTINQRPAAMLRRAAEQAGRFTGRTR
jgi:hypothetical protein